MSRPPVSKHTPLPTSVTRGAPGRAKRRSIRRGARGLPRPTAAINGNCCSSTAPLMTSMEPPTPGAPCATSAATLASSSGPMSLAGVLIRSRASCCDAMAAASHARSAPARTYAVVPDAAASARVDSAQIDSRRFPSPGPGSAPDGRTRRLLWEAPGGSPPAAGDPPARHPASTGRDCRAWRCPGPRRPVPQCHSASGTSSHFPRSGRNPARCSQCCAAAGCAAIQPANARLGDQMQRQCIGSCRGSVARGSGVTRCNSKRCAPEAQRHFCRYNDRLTPWFVIDSISGVSRCVYSDRRMSTRRPCAMRASPFWAMEVRAAPMR